jgi:hypothetical protein
MKHSGLWTRPVVCYGRRDANPGADMLIADERNYHSSTQLISVFPEDRKLVGGHALLSVCVDDLAIGDLLDVDAYQQLTNMTSQWAGCWTDVYLSSSLGGVTGGYSICAQSGQNFNANPGNVHHLPFEKHFKWTSTKAMPLAFVTLRAWAATDPDRPDWTLQVDKGYGQIDVTKKRYQ